jgi:L-seryl-tRNA(Ser) seleniumtransferase
MSKMLPNLPSLSEVLESPPLKSIVERAQRTKVAAGARRFLDNLRVQMQSAAANVPVPAAAELAQQIADWLTQASSASVTPVINATGVLLHPSLGGPPLADDAAAAAANLARSYAALDSDLAAGAFAQRTREVEAALVRLTGAEAAAIVPGQRAALALAITALAGDGEVVAARGQLAECWDGTRIADVAAAAGARLREVGAANVVRASDFSSAIGQQTTAILYAQPSGFALAGRHELLSLADVAPIARQRGLPVISYLAECSLVALARYGVADCPQVAESLRSGADLVVLSTGQWIGGPDCGAVVGRADLVERIRQHPFAALLLVDKLAIAALAATLSLYDDPEVADRSLPVLSLLATPLANLRQRAERLAPQLAATGVASAEVMEGHSRLSGDGLPGRTLATVGIALKPPSGGPDALAAALRTGQPPVLGTIAGAHVWLDLRTVLPREDVQLVAALEALRPEQEPAARLAVSG